MQTIDEIAPTVATSTEHVNLESGHGRGRSVRACLLGSEFALDSSSSSSSDGADCRSDSKSNGDGGDQMSGR